MLFARGALQVCLVCCKNLISVLLKCSYSAVRAISGIGVIRDVPKLFSPKKLFFWDYHM